MFGLIGCGLAFFPKFASTKDPLASIDPAALGAMLPIVERGQSMDARSHSLLAFRSPAKFFPR
jgi:hypothetical protein